MANEKLISSISTIERAMTVKELEAILADLEKKRQHKKISSSQRLRRK